MAIKMHRMLAGEPTERAALVIETTTKAEIDRLLERTDESDDDEA
jgi:hypothetical protein